MSEIGSVWIGLKRCVKVWTRWHVPDSTWRARAWDRAELEIGGENEIEEENAQGKLKVEVQGSKEEKIASKL